MQDDLFQNIQSLTDMTDVTDNITAPPILSLKDCFRFLFCVLDLVISSSSLIPGF